MNIKQTINGIQERIELGLEYLETDPIDVDKVTEQINDAMREIERLKIMLGYVE